MKAYTDLEQSKKLAEILSIESADMFYRNNGIDVKLMWEHLPTIKVTSPAWSLAALINVLPSSVKDSIGIVYSLNMNKEYIEYSNPNISFPYSAYIHTCGNDNLVDACYEMIVKFHEQKIL